jgi:hypothetical protein
MLNDHTMPVFSLASADEACVWIRHTGRLTAYPATAPLSGMYGTHSRPHLLSRCGTAAQSDSILNKFSSKISLRPELNGEFVV